MNPGKLRSPSCARTNEPEKQAGGNGLEGWTERRQEGRELGRGSHRQQPAGERGWWHGVPARVRGLLGQAGSMPRQQPVEKTRPCSDASAPEWTGRPESPSGLLRTRTRVLNAYGNPEYCGELQGPLERDDLVPRFPLN